MQLPSFCRYLDGFASTLAQAHEVGSGTLVLTDASALGSFGDGLKVRLTVEAPDGSTRAQFLASARSGNSLSVTVDPGSADVALPIGSAVALDWSRADIADLTAAILATVGASNDNGAALATLLGQLATVARTGAYADLSGRPALAPVATSGSYLDLPDRPALGTIAAHSTADFLTPTGNGSGLIGLVGSQISGPIAGRSGTVATIAGLLSAGSGVTIAGAGTQASPYSIATSGGSGGSASPGGTTGALQYNGAGSLAGSATYFVDAAGVLQARYTAPNTGDQIPQTALYLRDDGQTTDFVRRGIVLDTHAATLGVAGYLRTGAAITLPAGSTTYNEVAAVDVGWDQTGNGEIRFWTGGRFNGDTAPSIAASIDRDGVLQVNKGFRYGSSTTLVVGFTNSADAAASLVVGTFSGRKGLVLQGNQYGGGNVLEVQRGPNDGGTALASLDSAGAYHPPQLADADAQVGSLYFSTTLGRLVFKDASGTAHALYS